MWVLLRQKSAHFPTIYLYTTFIHKVPWLIWYLGLGKCCAIPRKVCYKHWAFYDSPVLLTLVRSTSARRQGAAEKSLSIVSRGFVLWEAWTFNLNSELTSNFVSSSARQPRRHCSFYVTPTAMKLYLGRECLSGTSDSCREGYRWRTTQDRAGLRVPGTKTMSFASETWYGKAVLLQCAC
jgi:hypothetical protein